MFMSSYESMLTAPITLFGFCVFVLLAVARYKYFQKLGEEGWKGLIPVYSTYVLMERCWTHEVAVVYVAGTIIGFLTTFIFIGTLILFAVSILELLLKVKLAEKFNQDILFALGLMLLAPIFELILGFDNKMQPKDQKIF